MLRNKESDCDISAVTHAAGGRAAREESAPLPPKAGDGTHVRVLLARRLHGGGTPAPSKRPYFQVARRSRAKLPPRISSMSASEWLRRISSSVRS